MTSVVHILSQFTGGAGIAACRVHESLLQYTDVKSTVCGYEAATDTPGFRTIQVESPILQATNRIANHFFNRELRRCGAKKYFMGTRGMSYRSPFALFDIGQDITHLHWINGRIGFASLLSTVPPGHPLIWTLHDMYPFTGGCAYSGGCGRYATGCGECPQLAQNGPDDLSAKGMRVRVDLLRDKSLYVAAPSKWMQRQAEQSAAFRHAKEIAYIPYGVDGTRFAPRPKAACREALGIPADHFVICFGCEILADPRKGGDLVLEAVKTLSKETACTLLLFGRELPGFYDFSGCNVVAVGSASSAKVLSMIYSAADVMVVASREDNLPQVPMEAMSCGVAVVGSRTGGIPDLVHDNENGYLFDSGDAGQLTQALRSLSKDRAQAVRLGMRGREMVKENFSMEEQAENYLALYNRALGNAGKTR